MINSIRKFVYKVLTRFRKEMEWKVIAGMHCPRLKYSPMSLSIAAAFDFDIDYIRSLVRQIDKGYHMAWIEHCPETQEVRAFSYVGDDKREVSVTSLINRYPNIRHQYEAWITK